ncbi:hypothetical protein [Zooshikella ganghwensis]|uniref:hypothetical protein n=1 Tax=Zooshikella ganghwensis TaxID=202772 RepID=UPI0004146A64|nr:hypothetical protein [Zooshikella ganghwensis]
MNDHTPFSQTVAYINRGSLNDELTEKLSDIVKAVRETQKTGSITLQLKIQMLSNSDEDTIKISPTVKTSIPEYEQPKAVFWSTADGDLLRNDPKQGELELKSVPVSGENQKLKSIFNE